ncbi:MAG: hypothetical protein ACK4MJ_10420, partial [Hylemonella sp.]
LPYLGAVAGVFGLVPLGAALLGAALLVVLGYVAVTEVAKRFFYRFDLAQRIIDASHSPETGG